MTRQPRALPREQDALLTGVMARLMDRERAVARAGLREAS